MNGVVRPSTRSPLIATRLRAPSTSEHCIPRPRLLEALLKGARRLTVIHGPAGFGKTTLALQWRARLREEGKPVAWLSMDENDNDPLRFLAYLIEAIRSAEPSLGADLLSLLESQSANIAGFILTELVNQFHDYGEEFYLFLDDWHLVKDKKSEDAIAFLLEHAPANLHLVITSRSRPTLPILKLMVRNEVTEIQAADLRFDLKESECFFRDLSIDDADLRALLATTEGWVAALQLAMISLRSTHDREGLFRWISGKHHAVGDYLTESVLNSLPQELLDFLLNTSILGRFCGALCGAVTGAANGLAILERAEQLQLFIIPLDDEREWFRYHHLFAKYLQRRLERDHPERVRDLHLTASAWFESQGLAEEAVSHALAAGDIPRAINIVETSAMWFVERSYMATLLGLVGKLPRDQLASRPVLQTAIAWSNCLIHRPEQALAAVRHVETYIAAHGIADDDELALETNVIRACIEIYADRIEGVEVLVRPTLARAEALRPWIVAVAANVLTYVLMHNHAYEEAIELQRWARPVHERTDGPFSQMYGHCFAGMAAYEMGHHAEAEARFREALRLAQDGAGPHSHAARLAGAMLGKMYYEYNQIAEAEPLLEDSIALGVEGGVVDYSLASYICYARLIALRGEVERALQILDEGERTARLLSQERLTASVAAERVRLHACMGGTPRSSVPESIAPALDTSLPNYSDGIAAEVWEANRIASVRQALTENRPRDAHALLDPLFDYTTQKGQQSLARTAFILRGITHDMEGNGRAADDAIIAALDCCKAPRAIRPFLDEGPRIIAILERLYEQYRRQPSASLSRPLQSQVGRILDAARQHTETRTDATAPQRDVDGAAHSDTTLLEPLKAREIEVLKLVGEGKSNKEIARYLGIGIDTVKWYLKAIYGKLGVCRRMQAISEARRLRLFD